MGTEIHHEPIGALPTGEAIIAYTLENGNGMRATFLSFGGILVELEAPDRLGIPTDVTLGFDDIDNYILGNSPYFGALVGRFANRIGGASFTIDGKAYKLKANEGGNCLHGGPSGFSRRLFDGKVEDGPHGQQVVLTLKSAAGDGGFPGTLNLTTTISLTEQNGLIYNFMATTDAPTHVNITMHPYFNLAGQDSGSIRDHRVQIIADSYLPTDEDGIPTGQLIPIQDTPFDFREPEVLDPRLDSPDAQVMRVGGFDHTFVLDPKRDLKKPIAIVTEEHSGRKLEVYTSEPGIQFYTANSLDGSIEGKNGVEYGKHSGFCLETQHFPDSPNKEDFPSTLLLPNAVYESTTEYRFGSVD